MDKILPEHPPIQNAADYIDALLRPESLDKNLKWKFIEGRRMRDKFLEKVIVPAETERLP